MASYLRVAVVIPCFNEGSTIATVVKDFAAALPGAAIYVCDNNSTDDTAVRASDAGAIVRTERRQGKGHAVRRLFADVDADVYVMVDGDATYDAASAPKLIQALLKDNLDMVVGRRWDNEEAAFRSGHKFGNRLFTRAIRYLFGRSFKDILSGYRVLSRRFVKSFPMLSNGFEVETEMTVHALSLQMATAEVNTSYRARPEGSESKLRTIRDGLRISLKIITLLKDEKPFILFSALSTVCIAFALVIGIPIVDTFLETGLVPRLPSAVLAASLTIIGSVGFALAISLDSLCRFRAETRRLSYLSYKSPEALRDEASSLEHSDARRAKVVA